MCWQHHVPVPFPLVLAVEVILDDILHVAHRRFYGLLQMHSSKKGCCGCVFWNLQEPWICKLGLPNISTSLQYANYYYPDADSLKPTKVICAVGSAVCGECDTSGHLCTMQVSSSSVCRHFVGIGCRLEHALLPVWSRSIKSKCGTWLLVSFAQLWNHTLGQAVQCSRKQLALTPAGAIVVLCQAVM